MSTATSYFPSSLSLYLDSHNSSTPLKPTGYCHLFTGHHSPSFSLVSTSPAYIPWFIIIITLLHTLSNPLPCSPSTVLYVQTPAPVKTNSLPVSHPAGKCDWRKTNNHTETTHCKFMAPTSNKPLMKSQNIAPFLSGFPRGLFHSFPLQLSNIS